MANKKKKHNRYTMLSYVFIIMGLLVVFMMSDVAFTERNNLTLLKGAITSEFNGKSYYDGIGQYQFMITQVQEGESVFLDYMDSLGYEMTDSFSEHYYYEHDQGQHYRVHRTLFLKVYYLWDFEDLNAIEE